MAVLYRCQGLESVQGPVQVMNVAGLCRCWGHSHLRRACSSYEFCGFQLKRRLVCHRGGRYPALHSSKPQRQGVQFAESSHQKSSFSMVSRSILFCRPCPSEMNTGMGQQGLVAAAVPGEYHFLRTCVRQFFFSGYRRITTSPVLLHLTHSKAYLPDACLKKFLILVG